MKNLYRIIIAGIVAICVYCSDDPSTAGATTEPSSSPIANSDPIDIVDTPSTKMPISVLVRAVETLIDISPYNPQLCDYDSLANLPDTIFMDFVHLQFSTDANPGPTQTYVSKDQRNKCTVTPYPEDAIVTFKDQLSYREDYISLYTASKFIQIEGYSVIIKTIVDGGYWGYGVSCPEYLAQFKKSCEESNGYFKNLGSNIFNNYMNAECYVDPTSFACSMPAPKGMDANTATEIFLEEAKNACIEDSLRYAPFDNEQDTIISRFSEGDVLN